MTLLRVAIILAVLAAWEFLAHSGWLYRDVVPSLLSIGRAMAALLTDRNYYYNLGVTAAEIGTALAIGGSAGLVGRARSWRQPLPVQSLRALSYYLGPTPKMIFFPVMIMWFGVGPESKVALGTLSCSFPLRSTLQPECGRYEKVLIRVGRSFRASTWQMVQKIYLPAMRHPIINGVRLGFGFALIGTLLAETKLSNKGIGFLIIQTYSISTCRPCTRC